MINISSVSIFITGSWNNSSGKSESRSILDEDECKAFWRRNWYGNNDDCSNEKIYKEEEDDESVKKPRYEE